MAVDPIACSNSGMCDLMCSPNPGESIVSLFPCDQRLGGIRGTPPNRNYLNHKERRDGEETKVDSASSDNERSGNRNKTTRTGGGWIMGICKLS